MQKTLTNNPMSALADESLDQPITAEEIDELEGQLEQSRTLAVLSTQPMDLDQFRMIKETGRLRSSYTGVKPVALEDYFNKEIHVKGYFVQDLENVDEETGVVTRWRELRVKLDDGTVIACSGKGANAFINELQGQGFPQGDWPEETIIRVHRRKLNSVTKDGQPKYMPTFQIVG